MNRKKVLITGGSGLLAVNWALSIRDNYAVTLLLHHKKISLSGVDTDVVSLSSLNECLSVLKKYQPDVVIHTVGITNVEECESNLGLAQEVNVDLAKNMAVACSQQDVKLVHISTDHLFLGNQEFSLEEEKTNPVNNYSKTKLLGEQQVLERCEEALIIRTNFFGWGTKYRQSFSDFILNKLRNNEQIDLFYDVFFTPILISELSKKVHQLIDKNFSGIFNVVGSERLSKYEFGIKLSEYFNLDSDLIRKISINDKPNLVKRPVDMSLSNAKLCKALNCKIASLGKQLQNLKDQEGDYVAKQIVLDIIPYGKHYIDEGDIQSVVDVLRHGMLTQGPKVAEFENKVANYVGAKYAIAVANGTAALHLACMVLELCKGDEVITSPNTFVATSNSVLYVGAKPVFVDIDKRTLNIDIDQIEQTILDSKNIKAIFPVHFGGLPCDMKRIKQLAEKYNLAIVEDAAHALGSTYDDGSKVGNCKYSEMTIFSFHPVKGIAAGEGGMIMTNDHSLYHKLSLLRSHGITKGNFEFPGISKPDNALANKKEALENGELKRWYYEMQYLGYNYRITDIQCALAISQMDKINLFLNTRKLIAKFYDQAFEKVPNITPLQGYGRNNSSHHIYVVSIDFSNVGISRSQFMKKLADQGIGSQVHYIPVVNQPYYKALGYKIDQYPVTKEYYENVLSIPLYYGLSSHNQNMIVSSIIKILNSNKS
jgi:UDP-4-amino-4,6-dideoxy-N-acetyl-beta-L-altrosamine transaminase/dTDP-4-dehydrorhamnose reductase